jgi:3-phosphoglycerate kinase
MGACLRSGQVVQQRKTFATAKVIMGDETEEKGMITIIGGRWRLTTHSASATEFSGDASLAYHTNTGGGTSLELLEGTVLPGINRTLG